MKFTDRQVRNLKPQEKRYEIRGPDGLSLRVSPSGRKVWSFWYRFQGETRRMLLGAYPAITVAKAHERHGKALSDLEHGIDPGPIVTEARRADREADTIGDLAHEYIERHAKPNKRSWKTDQEILDREILPHWKKKKAKDISRRDAIALLDGIKARGSPTSANRTLAIVRKMFNWALSRDMIPSNPCAGILRPSPEKARDRVLESKELETVWKALNAAPDDLLSIPLQLILATAQRPGEVLGARWSEIDLESKWWLLPGDRTKNGLAHRVPLSSLALRLLANARFRGTGSDLVFSSPRGKKALTRQALARRMRALCGELQIPKATPHDLRRTAASHMTAAGISRLVVSKILNHSDPSITAIYDRFSYDPEKQAALETWGRRLERLGAAQKEMA